mmetsp:Transcript_52934/g.158460  ORF Transcript_52934/g.158460 Transcript_52934/m.158460 type:complete len:236 (+) Transcript_52934:551-1258(+)
MIETEQLKGSFYNAHFDKLIDCQLVLPVVNDGQECPPPVVDLVVRQARVGPNVLLLRQPRLDAILHHRPEVTVYHTPRDADRDHVVEDDHEGTRDGRLHRARGHSLVQRSVAGGLHGCNVPRGVPLKVVQHRLEFGLEAVHFLRGVDHRSDRGCIFVGSRGHGDRRKVATFSRPECERRRRSDIRIENPFVQRALAEGKGIYSHGQISCHCHSNKGRVARATRRHHYKLASTRTF